MNPEQPITLNAGHPPMDSYMPIGQLSDPSMFTESMLHYTQPPQAQHLINSQDYNNGTLLTGGENNYHAPAAPVGNGATSSGVVVGTSLNAGHVPPTYDDIFPALPESEPKPVKEVHVDQRSSKMRIRSSNVTQVFQVAPDERRYRDNMTGSPFSDQNTSRVCSDIMKDTGTTIETSLSKDGTITFLITGREEDVIQAKRRISSELKTQSTASLIIPKKHHKFILGKSSKRKEEIEKKTNTRIQIPPQKSDSEEIKIIGSREAIDRAIHALQSISNEYASKASIKLTIPKHYHPFLSGPFQETLHEITEETGAKINIPPANVLSDEITVTGDTESVERAQQRLMAIYEMKSRRCHLVHIEVKKSQHRYIIGKGRKTIDEIFKNTGVSIEIPPQENPSETITLIGDQEKLGLAIQELCERANSGTEELMSVERWIQKRILGPKGLKLQELMNTYSSLRTARFLLDEDQIKFQGTHKDVQEAMDVIGKEINRIRSEISVKDVPVPIKYHRHIIGKNGAIIKQIRDNTGVQIHVPSESEQSTHNANLNQCDNIRIEGSHEGVERAYQALRERIDLLEKKENEYSRDLIIDQRFHKQLIGTKGEKIREIRDRFNQVAINIPDPNSKSEKVTIRGVKEDVDECLKFLAQFNKDLLANNYITEVPITKDICKLITSNSVAKKIKEETSVKIDVPANIENQKTLNVTISGKKENVEKAKQKLLEMIKNYANWIHYDLIILSKYHTSLKRKRNMVKEQCGEVTIDFPAENARSDKVVIYGPKESAMKAKTMLHELSLQLEENDYEEELDVNQRHRRDLQTRYKQHLFEIENNCGVTVKFREEPKSSKDVIWIKGRQENVNKAKEECEQLIKELESVEKITIDVDAEKCAKYHLKQFFSRKRMEEKISNVDFKFLPRPPPGVPGHETSDEQIMLRGPKESVDKARAYIEDIIETITSVDCDIDYKYHSLIRGRNWSRVNSIQHDHDVHIKFPARETANTNGMGAGGEVDLNNGNLSSASPSAEEESVLSDSDRNSDKHTTAAAARNIITIYGKQENCVAAKEKLTPIEIELEVPFDYHRFIIGQKGKEVREIMKKYAVDVIVPEQSMQSDTIKIVGIHEDVDEAKKCIQEKVVKLNEEKEDRERKSFHVEIHVEPKYHPKIIGRKGANINLLRKKYQVNVQFPEKHGEHQQQAHGESDTPTVADDLIVITGYEEQANAAAQEIRRMVQELSEKVTEELEIDSRVHSRLIGSKGKNIRKMMETFKVEIKFPRPSDPNPNLVSIIGNEDDVARARDEILDLTEEYLESIPERPTEHKLSSLVNINDDRSSSAGGAEHETDSKSKGFQVRGGPWEQGKRSNNNQTVPPDTTNTEEFPSMNTDSMSDQSRVRWGPNTKLPSSNVTTFQNNFP